MSNLQILDKLLIEKLTVVRNPLHRTISWKSQLFPDGKSGIHLSQKYRVPPGIVKDEDARLMYHSAYLYY